MIVFVNFVKNTLTVQQNRWRQAPASKMRWIRDINSTDITATKDDRPDSVKLSDEEEVKLHQDCLKCGYALSLAVSSVHGGRASFRPRREE